MPIKGVFYRWSEGNINLIKEQPGVYVLYDVFGNLIYVGGNKNLRKKFLEYWNNDFGIKYYKRYIKSYKREYVKSYKIRKIELLKEYHLEHDCLPIYNEKNKF